MMINFEKVSKEYVLESGNFTVLKPTDLHVAKGNLSPLWAQVVRGKFRGGPRKILFLCRGKLPKKP